MDILIRRFSKAQKTIINIKNENEKLKKKIQRLNTSKDNTIEQLKKELQSRPTKEEVGKMIAEYVFNNVPMR